MTVRVVGVLLLHNEDVFVEQSVRNVAEFCDRLYAFDHLSTDGTGEILAGLASEYDHLSVRRTSDARESHRVLEPLAGTPTWALGVDGDELYDPGGLARLRSSLDDGAYADAFHVKAHVLNCTELDAEGGTATGHMAPPSRPVTKFFNLAAVESWSGCLERLHGGATRFRSGYDWESLRYASDDAHWSDDPLRMLHVCFLRRSSADVGDVPAVRLGLPETGAFRRGPRGFLHRLRYRRHIDPRMKAYQARGSTWKQEWYARGPLVTVDARPFLASVGRRRS